MTFEAKTLVPLPCDPEAAHATFEAAASGSITLFEAPAEFALTEGPGLLTWSEIWCDVENSKSFRSSRGRRVFPGHRLKGASALHNYLASIFTASSVTTWSDMSGKHHKEPGHQTRDTASPVDNVRSPGAGAYAKSRELHQTGEKSLVAC